MSTVDDGLSGVDSIEAPGLAATETAAGDTGRVRRRTAAWRLHRAVRDVVAGTPIPVLAIYAAAMAANALLFAHGDLHWTINNAYAYLDGHILDFYDYNLVTTGESSYYPTMYIIFALLLLPMKAFFSHGEVAGGYASSWDVLWIKGVLLLVFYASAWVLSRISRQMFPDRPIARQTVQIAYLLSPLVGFTVGAFGQYDVIAVLFMLLGLLHHLRGNKWRFALFFGLAISCKFLPLLIFAPLLVLAYKRWRDLILLSLVAASVVVVEALPYLGSPAFRERTLVGLAADVAGNPGQRSLVLLVAVVLTLGCTVLWRLRPSREAFAPIAVHSVILTYSLVLLAVAWHPQWFVILTPFYALSLGFLRRPLWFLVWESITFLGFIWYVVNRMPANVDVTMVLSGPMRTRIDGPNVLLRSFYPPDAMEPLSIFVVVMLLSPLLALLLQRFGPAEHAVASASTDRRVPSAVWYLRALTVPLVFTLPAMVATWLPLETARGLDTAAGTYTMRSVELCSAFEEPYGEIDDGSAVRQSFTVGTPGVQAISAPVGTYGRSVQGELNVVVRDGAGGEVAVAEISLEKHADNARVYVDTSAAPLTEGIYTLDLETRGLDPGEGIALWGSSSDCYPGDLTTTGVPEAGDLSLTLHVARS